MPLSDAQRNLLRAKVTKQQKMLLFLRHCAKCQITNCKFSANCEIGKSLWAHIMQCSNPTCTYQRCVNSRDLLKHHQKCQVRVRSCTHLPSTSNFAAE